MANVTQAVAIPDPYHILTPAPLNPSDPYLKGPVRVTETSAPDMRVRLTPLHPDDIYSASQKVEYPSTAQFSGPIERPISAPLSNTALMSILATTGGMLFPYTPQISFTQAVNYMDLQLVHSNTDYPAYTRTPSVSISITGKFTVQNQTEGRYALACLHFLRTVSKCYFGEQDAANNNKAGLPPPILVLSGYGNYMFNQLRVVLKNHNWSFDDSVDGVTIRVHDNNFARLPSMFSLSCELMVVQTPQRMREKFSFDKFASGDLMENQVGWI